MSAKPLLSLALCLLTLIECIDAQIPIQAYQNIDPSTDLNALPNNSLYLRWRPKYHILSANGHMNDPCGPMYDPATKLYHIFYQSFPQHVQFGNTSWSQATSPDLISWTDVTSWQNRSMVAIPTGPYPEYDWIGAFSGGAQPVNRHGDADGNLTLMYTGASRFPDNWQLPYASMTEQQAMAPSSDGGKTWQKYEGNPVIDSAPGGWNVTGLRDPLFQSLPELDSILGVENGSQYYLTMGSGIRGVGPRVPLYTASSSDLTNWTFQGALFELPENATFGGDETRTGNFGYNFEMAGIFPLTEKIENGGDGKTKHWALTMGAEGYPTGRHPLTHWSLFALGSMSKRINGSVQMNIDASGVLDWAESYALNQFYDPVHDRRVIWGWIPDNDLNDLGLKAQGFAGSLGLPRELFIKVYSNVVAPSDGIPLSAETWTPESDGLYTVKTLGQRPLADVVSALQSNMTSIGSLNVSDAVLLPSINSSTLHIDFTTAQAPDNGRLSMLLRASPDYEEYVNVTYLSANETIVYDSSMSSLLPNLTKPVYVSAFTPFQIHNSTTNTTTVEAMKWSVFIDGSLVEVFINDRYALSSRTYPSLANATGIAFEASQDIPVLVSNITVWQSMINVWPNRPVNASSPLVFDPYYETHVTFPNPYVPDGTQLYDGYR